MNLIGKYLGEKKIVNFELSEYKTPQGAGIIKVSFEDESNKLIPTATLEIIATDKPLDASSLRELRLGLTAQKAMEAIAETDLNMSDFDYLFAMLKNMSENSFVEAERIKWGTPDKTLLDVDRVLTTKRTVKDVLK